MPKKNNRPLPFQSSLNPYKNDILEAWHTRKTLREIQAELAGRGMIISISGLSRFIRSRKLHADPHDFPISTSEAEQPRRRDVSPEDRSARISAIIQRELAKDPQQIEWEHFVEENRKKRGHGK